LVIDKLKSHISPGTDQTPVELMKAGGRIMHYEIHQFIISIWSKKELPEQWKESIIVHIYKKCDKKTVVIIEAYHFCQLRTKFYPTSYCEG